MQAMEGSFSFGDFAELHETQLYNGTTMRIEKAGPAIARVYFVDDNSEEVSIPDGFVVHDVEILRSDRRE